MLVFGGVPSLKLTAKAPEHNPLEKEVLIGNHHFQGRSVSFGECILGFDRSFKFAKGICGFHAGLFHETIPRIEKSWWALGGHDN